MIRNLTLTCFALGLTTACSVAVPQPDPISFAPTVTRGDVTEALAEAQFVSNAPVTSAAQLPTGSTTYTGKLGAQVSGDANGSILGDMTMRVGFATNSVGGDISNINLIDPDGTPNQRFDGQLLIDGVESTGKIDAFASGDLTGVDVNGNILDTQMLLILEGEVRNDFGTGDAVFGTATGQAEGDFFMDVDGVFYGHN